MSVSIVIPVFNGAGYLPGAVESVLSQSCGDWQLILVDDGSTDGLTPAMCDEYAAADPRISALHKPNGGLSDARNFAFPHIKGEFIAFLDADDLLHPDFVRLMLDTANDSGADIVFGGIDFFKESFKILTPSPSTAVSLHTPIEVVRTALYQSGFDNGAWGKIYRRSLWNSLRFTKGRYYEDLDIFYRIVLEAKSVACIHIPLYGYRQHDASFIHTWSPHRLDVLDVTDDMLEWVRANAPVLLDAAADRRMSAHFNILLSLYKNNIHNAQVEERCWNVIKQQRRNSWSDSRVRLKNKIGVLASLAGGKGLLKLLSRIF